MPIPLCPMPEGLKFPVIALSPLVLLFIKVMNSGSSKDKSIRDEDAARLARTKAVRDLGKEGGLFRACMDAIAKEHSTGQMWRQVLTAAGVFTDRNCYAEVLFCFGMVTQSLERKLWSVMENKSWKIARPNKGATNGGTNGANYEGPNAATPVGTERTNSRSRTRKLSLMDDDEDDGAPNVTYRKLSRLVDIILEAFDDNSKFDNRSADSYGVDIEVPRQLLFSPDYERDLNWLLRTTKKTNMAPLPRPPSGVVILGASSTAGPSGTQLGQQGGADQGIPPSGMYTGEKSLGGISSSRGGTLDYSPNGADGKLVRMPFDEPSSSRAVLTRNTNANRSPEMSLFSQRLGVELMRRSHRVVQAGLKKKLRRAAPGLVWLVLAERMKTDDRIHLSETGFLESLSRKLTPSMPTFPPELQGFVDEAEAEQNKTPVVTPEKKASKSLIPGCNRHDNVLYRYVAKLHSADELSLCAAIFCLWGPLVIGGGEVTKSMIIHSPYGSKDCVNIFKKIVASNRGTRRARFIDAFDGLGAEFEWDGISSGKGEEKSNKKFNRMLEECREYMQLNNDIISSVIVKPWWHPNNLYINKTKLFLIASIGAYLTHYANKKAWIRIY